MLKNFLAKCLQARPKLFARVLRAAGIRAVVFETAYGEMTIPLNSKSVIRAFLSGRYFGETAILRFLELQSTAPMLLNIGANVGTTARIFQKLGRYTCLKCFEPDPENFAVLLANCGEAPATELYNTAIGSKQEVLPLNRNPESIGRHSFKNDFAMGSIEVTVDPLDKYVQPNEIFDLFMDVEGWEIEVLRGARCVLQRCQLCAFEWNGHLHDRSDTHDVKQIMIDAGFKMFADLDNISSPRSVRDFPAADGQIDVVFLRDRPTASNVGPMVPKTVPTHASDSMD